MVKCNYCGKVINGLPWTCRRCEKTFCGEHRLPENHKCENTKDIKFSQPSTKNKSNRYKTYKSHNEDYEMYNPKRKSSHNYHKNFTSKNFLNRYIYPRIQNNIKPYLTQFFYIFLIGLVLNYVYYQTFSLNYLFIGGVNEWFSVLMSTLNGFEVSYDLFYLIINGIYYAYFYYSFILVIYYTITNLNKRDTWIMLTWFAIILFILIKLFPQIV
jgi:hypothetical protein